MNSTVILPLLASIISFIFTSMVLDQFLRRHKTYQIVWTVGLFLFALAANCVVSILLALQARHHTGKGQYLDIAMADGVIALLGFTSAYHMAGEPTPPTRTGTFKRGLSLLCDLPDQRQLFNCGSPGKEILGGIMPETAKGRFDSPRL